MIRFRGVSFAYRQAEQVLKAATFDLPAGLTLVLGPNGSGKSTLLKLAAGIERPDEGTAEIEGCDLWRDEVAARRNLAYVPEQPDLTPYATIRDVMTLVCRLRAVPRQHGAQALAKAGLLKVADRSIRELSSGQRRRAVLAAAWIGAPHVAILDEPLEAMDRDIRSDILQWIERLLAAGAALVIATHELEPYVADTIRVLVIRDGAVKVVEPLPADPAQKLALLESLRSGT